MLSPPTLEPAADRSADPAAVRFVAPGRPPRSEQERADRARMRTIAVPVVGLVLGTVLALCQTHLAGELQPLVQSAAAFLVAPFLLGALMRTSRGAVLAGLVCALAQLGAWAGIDALRGAPLHSGLALSLLACAVVGGPLLGGAGHIARRASGPVRGLGITAAAAVLIAEGAWQDLYRLHAETIGWLSIAIGVALAALGAHRVERARWLALTLPLALAGEIALTQIHR